MVFSTIGNYTLPLGLKIPPQSYQINNFTHKTTPTFPMETIK